MGAALLRGRDEGSERPAQAPAAPIPPPPTPARKKNGRAPPGGVPRGGVPPGAPPVLTPPVLMTAPTGASWEAARVILDRGLLTPQLRVAALEGKGILAVLVRV